MFKALAKSNIINTIARTIIGSQNKISSAEYSCVDMLSIAQTSHRQLRTSV